MAVKTPQEIYLGTPPDPAYAPRRDDIIDLHDDHQSRLAVADIKITALDGRIGSLEATGTVGYTFVSGGPVAAATTGPITLSGEQAVDGVTTASSRILVKDQDDPAENGVYVSAAGAWARAGDMAVAADVQNSAVFVADGGVNVGKTYVVYSSVAALEVDPIQWIEIGDQSGVTQALDPDRYLVPKIKNRLPSDTDYPKMLDMRSSSDVVNVPGGDLELRGYTYAVNWWLGNEFARWASGEDQIGKYVFGAFLVYSTNPANLGLSNATIYTEDAVGALSVISGYSGGVVTISSQCVLVWAHGQVANPGDANILLGSPSVPVDTTRYATGYLLHVANSPFDTTAMVRQILLGDQVRADGRAAALLIDVKDYGLHPNLLEFGDYYGGAPETRTPSPVKNLPVGALRDLGYQRGIDFGDRPGGTTNNYWRYKSGTDLNGKYCVGMFLCWAADGLEVPLSPAAIIETTGGAIAGVGAFETGSVDLGGNVHLVWVSAQIGTAGYENFLIGSIASPTDVYCTGIYVNISDTPHDIDEVIAAYTYRQSIMSDVARRVPVRVGSGVATLVLGGTGNVESYVESSLSGETIKRTFTAFPTYSVDGYPVLFNIGDDYVNGVQVRANIGDDTPPDHLFGGTIGGNHGYRLGRLTAAGHGKTQVDQGSIWTAGGTEYLLVEVVDVNTLLLTERSGNGAPPTGTYTHVSGATNIGDITVTAQSFAQWYPPFKNRHIECFVDGEKISDTSGAFSYRQSVQFIETYDILAKGEMVTWWEANGGSGNIEPDGDPSVRITLTYEFDRDGQLTIYRDWLFLKSTLVNDLMGIQSARASGTTHYYIPNTVAFTHDGTAVNYSLIEAADRTSTGGQVSVNFTPTEAEATGPFVDRVLSLFGSDYVFAQGFLPVGDVADDAARRALCSARGLEIRGNTDKLYFRVVDKGDFTAVAGEYYSAVAYRHIFPRPTERTAAYPVRTRGADYLYIDWHNVAKVDRVQVPSDFAGRNFEIVASRNVTLYSEVLTGWLNVHVAATGDYGFLVLRILR